MPVDSQARVLQVGRYAVHDRIASGGMATVHIGRLLGTIGFSRTVAIKRLHPALVEEPELVSMLIDEANLAARIRHPNVVQTLDAVSHEGEVFLIMEYVGGESLASLLKAAQKKGQTVPLPIASAIVSGLLHGLHAAHEATSENGEPLGLVHRDVSPQNILVGVDGVPRLIDFGVAKAIGRIHTTRDGAVKGKVSYMSPEQLRGIVSRRTDIYAAGVVLWELLAGRKLFRGEHEAEIMQQVLVSLIDPPSKFEPALSADLDAVVMRALASAPEERYATARDMALDLERTVRPALASEVAEWVDDLAHEPLARRAALVAAIEANKSTSLSLDATTGSSALRALAAPVVEAEASQKSIASVTGPRGSPPKAGRFRIVAIAAVGGVALGGLLSFWRLGATRGSIDAEPDVSRAPAATAAPSTTPVVTPATTAKAEASASASAAEAPSASVAPPPTTADVPRSRAPRAPANTRKAADPDCANPTIVDKVTGKITFKRKCLH